MDATKKVAQRRAEERGPDIFSGEDALREVAKPDGAWNWALVAPDPIEMPLSGGGSGSVEEMRDTISKYAHSFGLLRMEFGVPPAGQTRWLFIHASDPVDSGKFTAVQRGKAMAMSSKIERFAQEIVAYSARVQIHSPEECTVENIVEKLVDVLRGMGSEYISVDEYWANREHYRAQHFQEEEAKQKALEEAKRIEEEQMPKAVEVAQPEEDVPAAAEEADADTTRQRKKVKLYH